MTHAFYGMGPTIRLADDPGWGTANVVPLTHTEALEVADLLTVTGQGIDIRRPLPEDDLVPEWVGERITRRFTSYTEADG